MADKLCFFYSTFSLFVCAIFAQPFVQKLSYANCGNLTSTVFTQFTLEIKNLVLANWVVFAVCNGRVVFLLGSYRWYLRM